MARRLASSGRHASSAHALRTDDSGQMMMLAAVILVLGFIAMAGMVARVGQLGLETGREQQRPILLEIEPMKEGLDDAIARLVIDEGFTDTGSESAKVAYENAVVGILEHARMLEASRGFLLEYNLECSATAGKGHAEVSLADGELWIQIHTDDFVRPASAGC